eukprot:5212164-Pleurochrysis_carterae.AAC.3
MRFIAVVTAHPKELPSSDEQMRKIGTVQPRTLCPCLSFVHGSTLPPYAPRGCPGRGTAVRFVSTVQELGHTAVGHVYGRRPSS